MKRRDLLYATGTIALSAIGLDSLVLPASAVPTEASGICPADLASLSITEDNILGPYYRPGAPFRTRIAPPNAPGQRTLVSGRVWGYDTRRPLPGVVLDIWQADKDGHYDNDESVVRVDPNRYRYRARLLTDARGYYQFETVHPGAYQTRPNRWRPSHIHYMVGKPGYRTLVTQLYFQGDRYNGGDRHIKPSLTVDFRPVQWGRETVESGIFDIVLAPA